MYLYLFITGQIKQVWENPTIVDMMGVQAGTLRIIKYDSDGRTFKQISVKEGKVSWDEVQEAETLTYKDSRVHQ